MLHPNIRREIAERYNRELPDEVRSYLKGRGIPATTIERQLLGWNGERITIPIFGRKNEVLGFRYAKMPADPGEPPVMLTDFGLEELYGWETLMRTPQRVVICEGEFERLVLEAHGFAAVTSTAGAATFREEWLPYFEPVTQVFICFDRDLPGTAAAKKMQRLLPRARIVTLPPEVGLTAGITEFFGPLGRTPVDFELLLASARGPSGAAPGDEVPAIRELRPLHKSVRRRAEALRRSVRLADLVSNYSRLEASESRLIAHCPFHTDPARSFSIYPETNTYRCTACGVEGDVVQFVMDKESMTVGQALEALEHFRYTHELYGTS